MVAAIFLAERRGVVVFQQLGARGQLGEALTGPRICSPSFSRHLKRALPYCPLHLPYAAGLVEAVAALWLRLSSFGTSLNGILLIGITVPIFQMRSPRLREMNP